MNNEQPTTMNTTPTLRQRYATDVLTIVREKDYRKTFDILEGAPDEWAAERGATHTMIVGNESRGFGSRPVRLFKAVLHFGADEAADGSIVWERWNIETIAICDPTTTAPPLGLK